jgi:hypothetical protein
MIDVLSVILGALAFASLGMVVYAKMMRMKQVWHSLPSVRGSFGEWLAARRTGNLSDPLDRRVYQDSRRWMIRGYLLFAFVVVASFALAWVDMIFGR